MSIRAIEHMTGSSKHTIVNLMNGAGAALAAYQDAAFLNLKTKRIQVDEIWSFTYAKAKNVVKAKAAPEGARETWTWTAIDADSKLVMSWLVGGRDGEYALAFMDDLIKRLANRVQLTSDGQKAYPEAVEGAFGGDIDYAMLVKLYGNAPTGRQVRYSPAECIGACKTPIEGNPDLAHVSTLFAESQT
jgi:hypothetical protein